MLDALTAAKAAHDVLRPRIAQTIAQSGMSFAELIGSPRVLGIAHVAILITCLRLKTKRSHPNCYGSSALFYWETSDRHPGAVLPCGASDRTK